MRRTFLAGLFTAMVVAGCSDGDADRRQRAADNTPEICAEYMVVYLRHSGESPEHRAWADQVLAGYEGRGNPSAARAAKLALDKAWVRDLRPLGSRATNPAISASLKSMVGYYEQEASGNAPSASLLMEQATAIRELCPKESASPGEPTPSSS